MNRTRALVVIAVLGFGLALAPVVFQMFTRAPDGGDMIEDFRRYMTTAEIEKFQGYLVLIGAADEEAFDSVIPELVDAELLDPSDPSVALPAATALHEQWPGIDEDMTDLLDTMQANLANFDSVSSLPPFGLFPWFFVVPGLVVGVVALVTLRRSGDDRSRRAGAIVLLVAGLGIVLAPAVFQMFTRAPDGAAMIDDFRPMMTQERVARVQGYFITMGAAEGELRNRVLTVADEQGLGTDAIDAYSEQWPTVVGEFAPMVATMSDNVDNFAGIDALPSFALFPWFFVVPGVLIAGLAIVVLRSRPSQERN